MGVVEIGFAGAFGGGVLTLLSPCAVMLLPAFFAYSFGSGRTVLARTGVFFLGLLVTLVPLGAGAGALGAALVAHRSLLISVGAAVVIAFGVLQALGVSWRYPGSRAAAPPTSGVAVFVLGASYGLAGTCSGPILGSMLAYAAFSASPVYAGMLFFWYAVGMVVPLLALAVAWRRFGLAEARWLRPKPVALGPVHTTVGNLVSGLAMVAIGVVLMVTEGTALLPGWLQVGEQASLEAGLREWTESVPDLAVLAGVALAGLGGLAWWLLRAGSQRVRHDGQHGAR
ncbi:MAG: cytochrome c biogenesis CcdA family protein [Propionicimonas sp.]